METLIAILIYLGALNAENDHFSRERVLNMAGRYEAEITEIYEDEKMLRRIESRYVQDDVRGTRTPVGIWIPDDGEIAY